MSETPLAPRRRVLRFSLRAMLLLVVVIGAALSWTMHKVRQQAKAVAVLEGMGCNLGFENSTLSYVPWMTTLVGNDGIRNVIFLDALNAPLTDTDLALASGLPHLRHLHLASTQVTDDGLANIQGLTELVELSLSSTHVGGQGLARLQELEQLQWLDLDGTQVTDAELVHLRGLSKLATLSLKRTKVTDTGIRKLREALPNCSIGN
jgi:hypothetical protein